MAYDRGFVGVPKGELRLVKKEVRRLAREIARNRKLLGFTQERFAERLNISSDMVSSIERGARMPSLPMLIRICIVLRMEIVFRPK